MTPEEVSRVYPCDDFVAEPTLKAWRGVTVRAAPGDVWPWVGQIRVAPYSYDWIDNLGRRSPPERQGLPDPVVGEPFTTALGGRRLGRIVATEPGVHLTATIMSTYMSYVLDPLDDGRRTRLLLKLVGRGPRLLVPLLSVGDLVMARRQLLNLATLSEQAN